MSRSSSTLNSATWIRSARSGSSFSPNTPRLARGHQPVVHGLRITQGAALGHLDRVDVADQVADRGVRGGQLLGVAVVAVPPADRQVVAVLGGQSAAADADRRVRVVVDLASGDLGAPLVEQGGHGAHQPGLALAALPQQHQVVAGQDRALQLRQHGVVEADDAGEGRLRRAQPAEQIGRAVPPWFPGSCSPRRGADPLWRAQGVVAGSQADLTTAAKPLRIAP